MQRLLTTILAVLLNGLDNLAWSKMLRSDVSQVKSNRKIFYTGREKKGKVLSQKPNLFLGIFAVKRKCSKGTCSPD